MWQISNHKYGAELPVDKMETYITICLNGAGLNDNNAAPSVAGYPFMKKGAANEGTLQYILLVGGYGDSQERILYDAVSGKALDNDKAKAEVIAWNSRGVG